MYADAETGLYYNRARYYDPKIGRYISSDPIGLAGGLNTYSYAYENPLRYTDPTGENVAWIPIIVTGAGAVIGGYVEGHKAYECGARGWQLAGPIGRGAVAGGTGALVGLAVGVAYKNPYLAGAAGSVAYDVTKGLLGGGFSVGQTTENAAVAVVTAGIARGVTPAVRGGSNFNPFTTERMFGPKATQLYSEEAISHEFELMKDDKNGKKCGCQ